MAAPSFQDLWDQGKAEAIALRPKLLVTLASIPGMLLAGAAAMADRVIGWAAGRIKATYLDGAAGDDLTTLCDDHWAIQRNPAVKSVGTVRFYRSSSAAGACHVVAGTVVATARDANGNEIRFVTLATVYYGPTETGAKTAAAEAETAGAAGNVAASQISRVVSSLTDASITVSNTAAMAGGAEAETDEELRDRVRAWPATLRRATLAALEYGAKSVDVVIFSKGAEDTSGLVTVYVTDSAGGSNATMVAAVLAELEEWRAAGALVEVVGGTLVTVDFSIGVRLRDGVSLDAVTPAIQAAVAAKVNRFTIGEILYPAQVNAAVLNACGDDATDVSVSVPSLPYTPAANEILRCGAVGVTALT